jgi:hypothetical protein
MAFHSVLRIVVAMVTMTLACGPDRPLARAAPPVRPVPAVHGGGVGIGITVGIPGYLD